MHVTAEEIHVSWENAEVHVLYKIAIFFFFKYSSEALFKVYFNSKIVGLMGWRSVVLCCQIAVRQSDHMIQTHTMNPCN